MQFNVDWYKACAVLLRILHFRVRKRVPGRLCLPLIELYTHSCSANQLSLHALLNVPDASVCDIN